MLPVSPLPDRFEVFIECHIAKEHDGITAIAAVRALEVLVLDLVWREGQQVVTRSTSGFLPSVVKKSLLVFSVKGMD